MIEWHTPKFTSQKNVIRILSVIYENSIWHLWDMYICRGKKIGGLLTLNWYSEVDVEFLLIRKITAATIFQV